MKSKQRLPHVLCILSDEHFGGAMSHMGDPNVQTPNMDRLAAEGVSFQRAYSNCPVCTPSRGTIFSGRYAHSGPVQGFWDVYKPLSPSLATMMRAHGYRTAYFGKWHCGLIRDQVPPQVNEHRDEYPGHPWVIRTPEWHRGGFEDWFAFEVNNAPFKGFYYHQKELNPRRLNGYQTDALTDLAIDYMENYDRDQPMLLVISVEPPHFPLDAPQRNRRLDPAELKVRPNFAETDEHREQLATYYAMIENLDENIGRLMETIGRLDRFRNQTLVTYISDHGEFAGSQGAFCRKEYPQEESVRVPYLFHWPGHIPARGLRDEMISLVDFVPTLLGTVGLPVPPHVQGRDMSAAVRGEDHQQQEAILLEMQGSPRWGLDYPDWRGLVTRRWKYCFYETGHEQLYDLEADPYEMHNLAEEQPEVREQLKRQLLTMLREAREPYFDVLIEHGAGPVAMPTTDAAATEYIAGSKVGKGIAPWWRDGSVRKPSPQAEPVQHC